jgi:BASS family bile acid:Na+ symporter
MKALQKASKFLSDYTSVVVIAIAIVTFFVPSMMGWVNYALFTDMVANKFTSQSIIIGVIMFSMGLTLTTEDFKILAQRPFDICVGAIAQYLIMPFLAFALTKLLHLPDGIALGLILVGCCPGGVSSNIMSYLWRCSIFCRNDNSIYTGFPGYDTAYGIISRKRNSDYD